MAATKKQRWLTYTWADFTKNNPSIDKISLQGISKQWVDADKGMCKVCLLKITNPTVDYTNAYLSIEKDGMGTLHGVEGDTSGRLCDNGDQIHLETVRGLIN